jgi:hypothetical protein
MRSFAPRPNECRAQCVSSSYANSCCHVGAIGREFWSNSNRAARRIRVSSRPMSFRAVREAPSLPSPPTIARRTRHNDLSLHRGRDRGRSRSCLRAGPLDEFESTEFSERDIHVHCLRPGAQHSVRRKHRGDSGAGGTAASVAVVHNARPRIDFPRQPSQTSPLRTAAHWRREGDSCARSAPHEHFQPARLSRRLARASSSCEMSDLVRSRLSLFASDRFFLYRCLVDGRASQQCALADLSVGERRCLAYEPTHQSQDFI